MLSVSLLKAFAAGAVVIVLGGAASTGVFLVGERIGRYRAARTVSEVMRGEREPEELERADLLPEDAEEKSYTARGLVIASGSGAMTIETKTGKIRSIQITRETRVRSGGAPVAQTTLRVGDTVFILGLPDTSGAAGTAEMLAVPFDAPSGRGAERPQQVGAPEAEMRARLIRIVSRGKKIEDASP